MAGLYRRLVQTSDVYADGLGPAALQAGQVAVLVFIIISGFVITCCSCGIFGGGRARRLLCMGCS